MFALFYAQKNSMENELNNASLVVNTSSAAPCSVLLHRRPTVGWFGDWCLACPKAP